MGNDAGAGFADRYDDEFGNPRVAGRWDGGKRKVRRPRCGVGRSAAGHYGDAAGEVCYERRRSRAKRPEVTGKSAGANIQEDFRSRSANVRNVRVTGS